MEQSIYYTLGSSNNIYTSDGDKDVLFGEGFEGFTVVDIISTSKDGKWIVTSELTGLIIVWKVTTVGSRTVAKMVHHIIDFIYPHEQIVFFNKRNAFMFPGDRDDINYLIIVDFDDDNYYISKMQANSIFKLTYELRIAISFDDSVIVGASGSTLYTWDVSTGQSRPSIYFSLIKDVALSNDGKLILIASTDFAARLVLYDLVNMKQKKVYFMKATSEPVRVAFMYNNKGTEVIMCIFESGIVNIYSIDGGSPLTTFNICPRMCRRDFLFARKSFVCQAGEKLLCYTADGKEIKIPAPEKSPTAFSLANISHFDLFQTLNILKKNELYLPKHVVKMIGYYEKIC